MATPVQDRYDKNAAAGIKKMVSDGESVEVHSLDELQRAADREAKTQASNNGRLGIKMFRVRSGSAAPQ